MVPARGPAAHSLAVRARPGASGGQARGPRADREQHPLLDCPPAVRGALGSALGPEQSSARWTTGKQDLPAWKEKLAPAFKNNTAVNFKHNALAG